MPPPRIAARRCQRAERRASEPAGGASAVQDRDQRTDMPAVLRNVVLEELAQTYEIPRLVLEYRQLAKLKSTYVDAIPALIHPKTGRVHTTFNQTGTATGRLSSSDPNLQNIPIRSELGRLIREAFVPDEGKLLLSADYSQVELRVLAHLAEDEVLIDAFRAGEEMLFKAVAFRFGKFAPRITINGTDS